MLDAWPSVISIRSLTADPCPSIARSSAQTRSSQLRSGGLAEPHREARLKRVVHGLPTHARGLHRHQLHLPLGQPRLQHPEPAVVVAKRSFSNTTPPRGPSLRTVSYTH